jgi:hypothetical protein
VTGPTKFVFDDAATFEQNLATFSARLRDLDAAMSAVLAPALMRFDVTDKPAVLEALLRATITAAQAPDPSAPAATSAAPSTATPAPPARAGWFLEQVQIEGVRGINNEGAPLSLKFKPDCVNSLSAPNGVGKSSIFDALAFALTGGIPKLDRLLQTERGQAQ